MAEVAHDLAQALARRAERGGPGRLDARVLAAGDGWRVADVVCSCGPGDTPFEEQHDDVAVAIVAAGTFQYRGSGTAVGRELMTPGSVMLGNPGQYYECRHDHAAGDRCVSFSYTPECFESITAGMRPGARRGFARLRLPAVRALSPVLALADSALARRGDLAWEELSVRVAALAIDLDRDAAPSAAPVSAAATARVTRSVRRIERCHGEAVTLADLAREANVSPFHYLRTFVDVTGVTPHQFVMRTRLRRAATRLVAEQAKVIDIAIDCGFGDLSNFNRAFRAEFGASPRQYRQAPSTTPR